MEGYDPATVFSSIDRHGRYAYANQAPIAQWNLARLAEALLPLIDDADAQRAVELATAVVNQFQGVLHNQSSRARDVSWHNHSARNESG
jgi:uncharacterized protein YdiU (UPF0061 family)